MGIQAEAFTVTGRQQRIVSIALAIVLVATMFATALALNGPTRAAAQVDGALADVVPAESVLYADADLDQTSDQWVLMYELLERSGLSDLAEEELDASPEEVGDMAEMVEFTGRAALVFTSADAFSAEALNDFSDEAANIAADPSDVASDVPQGFAVVFQPEDPQALYTFFQDMVADEAEENAATVETVDYNGTTIEYWESTDPEIDPTAVALIEETVVLAVRPMDVEPIVDTINGDLESLSSTESFNTIAESFTTPSISFGYVNTTAIVEEMATADPQVADALGDAGGYMGWNVYVDNDGFRMDSVFAVDDRAGNPLPESFDPTLADRVSADAMLFLNGNNLAGTGLSELLGVALQASFAESEGAMDPTPVATPSVEEVYAELESQLGFNLKTDFLDQMTGEFGVAVTVDQIFSAEPVTDVVFVSGVADETTVTDATDQIRFIVSSSVEDTVQISDREVTGGTVTSVVLPAEETGGLPITLEWGVINGEFLLGVNGGIDSYLDGATTPLSSDPNYEATMSLLPQEDVVGVAYLNLARLLPMIEEAASTMSTSTSIVDNDPACGDYATQEEAQEAYDADSVGLWNLDLDYDGEACEDFFSAGASPEASPESVTENLNLVGIGLVSYTEGDLYRTSSILVVGD